MIKCLKVGCFFCILSYLVGCSDTNKAPIIKFSTDSSAIIIKNIDKVNLLQLKNLVNVDSGINDYLKIMAVPKQGKSELNNQIVNGTVKVFGDSLIFYPTKKFISGDSYLIESYIGAKFGSVMQLLKGKGQTTIRPQRKILAR